MCTYNQITVRYSIINESLYAEKREKEEKDKHLNSEKPASS